jgi:tripartite-type tricarboxylate transporter receptor subunit TctC
MSHRQIGLLWAAVASASMTFPVAALSGESTAYPTKPIRIVVPYAPGGGTDIIARIIGTRLQERLGQPMVIDNRGGANGIVGANLVAASVADGYTLLACTTAVATNSSLYKNQTKYDPVKSFAPVSLAVQATMLLVVNPTLPARSVKELVALAKGKPGQLSFSSYGSGSSPHLAAALFMKMTGTEMLHVPFKGGAPAIAEVIAGRVTMTFATVSSVHTHVEAGRVKPLGVATLERNRRYKDLPTIAEAGVPGFEAAGGWTGVCAPAGTPPAIIDTLHGVIAAIMTEPEVISRFENLGYEVFKPMPPQQFAAMMRAETEKWAKIVAELNVRPD